MFTGNKKKIAMTVLTAVFSLAVILTAQAAARTAGGDGGGAWNFTAGSADGGKAQISEGTSGTVRTETDAAPLDGAQEPVNVSAGPGGQAIYEFDGKKYVIDTDWGTHYLTGFCPNADGSRRTKSGTEARQGYTVSSTLANLGKVILIQAESGPGDYKRYDGLYRCEDTGGPAVETGQPNTGYVPVVDLFFDTAESAANVSADGWISARIYILREVE